MLIALLVNDCFVWDDFAIYSFMFVNIYICGIYTNIMYNFLMCFQRVGICSRMCFPLNLLKLVFVLLYTGV